MAEEQKKKNGCLKFFGIGCAVIVLLGILAVVGAVVFKDQIARSGSAALIDMTSEAMLKESKLSAEEQDAVRKAVSGLTKKIRNGEISMDQAKDLLQVFVKGPLLKVFIVKAFEKGSLPKSGLTLEEKKDGEDAAQRFIIGIALNKIDDAEYSKFADIATIKTNAGSGPQPNAQLNQNMTDQEVKDCIKIMKDAADAAGISGNEKVDFGAMIQGEIDKALGEGSKNISE